MVCVNASVLGGDTRRQQRQLLNPSVFSFFVVIGAAFSGDPTNSIQCNANSVAV
jgi:hypothetical protein